MSEVRNENAPAENELFLPACTLHAMCFDLDCINIEAFSSMNSNKHPRETYKCTLLRQTIKFRLRNELLCRLFVLA